MTNKARVAVLISGAGSNMAALLYAARADSCPYEVVLVTGDNPDAPGLILAEAEGVPVVRLPRPTRDSRALFFAELDSTLRDADVDLVALAGFMRILPVEFVAAWDGKLLNIHPSLLPKYRGLDTHARALAAGDAHGGCSVHWVSAEVDAGEILGQTQVAILPGDTAETLADRVRIAEHQLYPRILAEIAARPLDADWIEGQIDALARTLPEVARKTSHGAPGWSVGPEKTAKLFAILADRHHGEEAIGLLVKASGPDEMSGLIEARPDHYYWPKYYGASGWLGLKLNRRDVDWDEVMGWLTRSWTSAAPARLTKLIRAADEL